MELLVGPWSDYLGAIGSNSLFSPKCGVSKRLIFLNLGLKLEKNYPNAPPDKLKFCKYAASPGLHLPPFPS